jgi:hypothetical protein
MKKGTCAVGVLSSCIIFLCFCSPVFSAIVRADCPCGYGRFCFDVGVRVQGYENYSVHDELVVIRQKYNLSTNATHIVCESVTDDSDVAHFELPSGVYWVDVRNVWWEITVENDALLVFPYPLFEDVPVNETDGNGTGVISEKDGYNVSLGFLIILSVMVIALILDIVYIYYKKKRKG